MPGYFLMLCAAIFFEGLGVFSAELWNILLEKRYFVPVLQLDTWVMKIAILPWSQVPADHVEGALALGSWLNSQRRRALHGGLLPKQKQQLLRMGVEMEEEEAIGDWYPLVHYDINITM